MAKHTITETPYTKRNLQDGTVTPDHVILVEQTELHKEILRTLDIRTPRESIKFTFDLERGLFWTAIHIEGLTADDYPLVALKFS